MFEITPSPEFSAWFESLSEPLAEEVAGSLELVASAVGLLSPAHVSRALLWFDGTGDGEPPVVQLRRMSEHTLHVFDRVRELMLLRREIVRCLDSAIFRERLAEIEPGRAARALAEVERVRQLLSAARTQTALESASRAPSPQRLLGVSTAREEAILAARFGIPLPASLLGSELEQAFRSVLELVGLDPGRVINAESGLRELTLARTTPKLRVLFGVDAPARRLIALLGEPLDRSYYGDSVRLAEQRWAEYCAAARVEAEAHDG